MSQTSLGLTVCEEGCLLSSLIISFNSPKNMIVDETMTRLGKRIVVFVRQSTKVRSLYRPTNFGVLPIYYLQFPRRMLQYGIPQNDTHLHGPDHSITTNLCESALPSPSGSCTGAVLPTTHCSRPQVSPNISTPAATAATVVSSTPDALRRNFLWITLSAILIWNCDRSGYTADAATTITTHVPKYRNVLSRTPSPPIDLISPYNSAGVRSAAGPCGMMTRGEKRVKYVKCWEK
ncbi:hypothetical protein BGY98DRAFT_16134 [Russula aff. rugulosa BPL654]|nr:hypothetical protein BGY98DRAFT_16134 [Russula aff. rugulosa BPL654]